MLNIFTYLCNMKKIFILSILIGVILLFKKIIVIGIIMGGYIVAPEAAQSLQHYCFGDGDTLHVKSNYLKTSPVVLKHLKTMKVGDKKWVSFKQHEDWRLSYALNPFTIVKKKDKVIIKQYIAFDSTGKVITRLNLGLFKINIKDDIAHIFDCKPFWFYHEFSY